MHGDKPHAPTVGLHDIKQWPDGPSCFDLVLVTEDLVERIESISVNADTDASDHQPVVLSLRD